MMASHMAMHREGKLGEVLYVFSFLHQKCNSRMAFDPTYPVIDMNDFKECKQEDFMRIYRRLPPLPPRRKEERKLTCMGMLIATVREKRRQGGSALGSSSS